MTDDPAILASGAYDIVTGHDSPAEVEEQMLKIAIEREWDEPPLLYIRVPGEPTRMVAAWLQGVDLTKQLVFAMQMLKTQWARHKAQVDLGGASHVYLITEGYEKDPTYTVRINEVRMFIIYDGEKFTLRSAKRYGPDKEELSEVTFETLPPEGEMQGRVPEQLALGFITLKES